MRASTHKFTKPPYEDDKKRHTMTSYMALDASFVACTSHAGAWDRCGCYCDAASLPSLCPKPVLQWFPAGRSTTTAAKSGIGTSTPYTVLDVGSRALFPNITSSIFKADAEKRSEQMGEQNRETPTASSRIPKTDFKQGEIMKRHLIQPDSWRPVVGIVLGICALLLPRALPAQTWSAGSGGAIFYDGGNVGIGTTTPATSLHLYSSTGTTLEFPSSGGVGPILNFVNTQSALHDAASIRFTDASERGELDMSVDRTPWGADFIFKSLNNSGVLAETVRITTTGNVGIGTADPQHLLHVAGTIGAEQVIVSSTGADYVFKPDYKLAPLKEVAAYIDANHHLPEIPSAAEAQEKGVDLGEMQTKLLAKVEELTLHMIQEDERNGRLEQQNLELRTRVARLESGESPKHKTK
jgi:hypothetical protein